MAKGEWMILLVDEVEIMFKNTDKSKSEETMMVLSAFQQLPLSSLLTPGRSPRPSLLPKSDTGALVFSATPALSQKLQTETWGPDEIWTQHSLELWEGGVDAGVTLLTCATNPRPSITILPKVSSPPLWVTVYSIIPQHFPP